jgi:hypothetical protein
MSQNAEQNSTRGRNTCVSSTQAALTIMEEAHLLALHFCGVVRSSGTERSALIV